MSETTTLPGKVLPAGSSLMGFDINQVVTSALASQFLSQGYAFCCRYLSLNEGQKNGDLSFSEALGILDAGLALVAVQHVLNEGWEPNAALGTTYGSNAASNAVSVGLPKGINIFCDLEGVASTTTAQNIIDYCQAWYNAVNSKGYVPGLYVGANCGLTGDQLYHDLSFEHYWKSMSNVPAIPERSYQMYQGMTITVNGLSIDPDMTQTDNEGGKILWLSK